MTPIIALIPQDTAGLPLADKIPKPSIQHTEGECPRGCGRKVWIGPKQLEFMHANPAAEGFCYFCLFAAAETDPFIADSLNRVVALNPDIDKVPRRPQ